MERQVTPLKLAIIASGRRQKDIAETLGMSEGALSLIVNGRHADQRTQERLAAELRQSRAVLFPAVSPVSPFGEAA